MIGGLGDAGVGRRVEAPLDVVALDDESARDRALGVTLPLRAGVDEDRPPLAQVGGLPRSDAAQPRPGVGEHVVDRAGHPTPWVEPGSVSSERVRRSRPPVTS
ncbi:hypothetical protein GCM10023403_19160 [Pseudonocardia benzenivorans]|nr:hypothetical protein PSD17_33330 [Pseudonocardia sp. D17]